MNIGYYYVHNHIYACMHGGILNQEKLTLNIRSTQIQVRIHTYINEAVVKEQAKNGGGKAGLAINIRGHCGANNGLESRAGGGIKGWGELGVTRKTSKEERDDDDGDESCNKKITVT